MKVLARAPGRVNLIGDHTDHTGGMVLPMAIDRWTEIELDRGVAWIELVSADEDEPAILHLDDPRDPSTIWPPWARYIAGVVEVLRPEVGGVGFVSTDVPIGAGLSSSAALEVAMALRSNSRSRVSGPSRSPPACRAGSWTSWRRPPASRGALC